MKYLSLFISLLFSAVVFAQDGPLYDLQKRIMHGEKKALFEIAPYFDSNDTIIEMLGYHVLRPTESQVAKRIVLENTLFTDQEMPITLDTKADEFLTFLHKNASKITFSNLADAFLITPLTDRPARAEFRGLSKTDYELLKPQYKTLLKKEWVRENKIDALIVAKNPKALLLIASTLYKIRDRYNAYNFHKEEYIDLLRLLIGADIGVENERKELSFHVEKEFYPDAALNMLIYFADNYSKFTWDNGQGKFINNQITISSSNIEQDLFKLLSNKNDLTALNAFTKLTTANPQIVIRLAKEYRKADINYNYALPTFPYAFLQQLVVLTDYCRHNNIDFTGSAQLHEDIDKLKNKLSFHARRVLEDKLIHTLTIEELTALEYWTMINEQNWELVFSTGRIVDIYYSYHWKDIINNDRNLKLYLKKSYLYAHLGIIGNNGEFLLKFINNGNAISDKLGQLQTDDQDILTQVKLAQQRCAEAVRWPEVPKKYFEGDYDTITTDIAAKIREIKSSDEEQQAKEKALIELLGKVNYNQIDTALSGIKDVVFKTSYNDKYSFMDRDWGILFGGYFHDRHIKKEFVAQYRKLNEYDLYAYYLDKAGIDYKMADGAFDYDKIYYILKYNIVDAFVGGGGGWRDNEVYNVIKLLELTFHTTLGYPEKLCRSVGIYGCSADDRATSWRQYLTAHHLLKQAHDEPVSFNYR